MKNLEIKALSPEELSAELLYQADEYRESVADYINRGRAFAACIDGEIVGQYILLHTRPFTAEIVNIAVAGQYLNTGIGKRLVEHAVSFSRNAGYRILEVGTGNCGTGQMTFYQKCGFRITHIEHDYFTHLFPEPFYENGIRGRDMVRMQIIL